MKICMGQKQTIRRERKICRQATTGKSISTTDPQIVADNTYAGYVWGSPAASAGQIIPNPHTITPP
jgi:hypothetical protein